MKQIAKLCVAMLALFVCTILGGCGSGHLSNTLELSLGSGALTVGSKVQLTATRSNTDGSDTTNVTNSVTWTSSQPSVATVSATGLLTGVSAGTTTITATVDKASGTLAVTISSSGPKSLTVTPATSTLPAGTTQQYTAMVPSSSAGAATSAVVAWSVSPANVASIDQTGLLQTKAVGTFTVTATAGSVTATAAGTVTAAVLTSVAITPAAQRIVEGQTQQYTATGTYSDQTTSDVSSATTWSSSNTALVSITNTGLATAAQNVNPGTLTIFAQVGTITTSTQASVVATSADAGPLTALVVTPTASSLAKNTGQKLTATGYYADGSQQDVSDSVTWTSNNPSTSTVNSTGLVLTSQPGAATIQASIAVPASSSRRGVHSNATETLQAQSVSLVTSATLVQVIAQSAVPTLPINAQQQLQLFGIFSDGTKQDLTALATWQSNNAAVATVSASGLATGVSAGGVTFTGSFGGQSDTTPTLQVTATSLNYITLQIVSSILTTGASQPITVTGHYSDGSTQDLTGQSSFASSNTTSITVNASGVALGLKPGESTVTATVQGQSSTLLLEAISANLVAITVTPATASFALGTTQPFRAFGAFSNNVVIDITPACTWGSTNPSVFTVDGTGLAKSGSLGTAGVTASFLGVTGVSGTVTVTPATLTGVVVSPYSVMLASGTSKQLTAVASFSDGTTQDVTAQANWSIANSSIAQTTNSGNAVAISPGSTRETASLMGFTGSTSVFVVSGASLASVVITPSNPTLANPLSTQLHLIGTFTDGTTQDLTQCALWTSSEPLVASVVLPGLLTATQPGTAVVTASCGSASAFTTVTTAAKTVASATVVPSQAQVAVGGDQSFQLLVTFTDGSTQILASNVAWTSSTPSVGTLAGPVAGEDLGHAVGVSPGVTTITASPVGGPQQAVHTATLYVTPKPLASIMVTPANPSISSSGTQQFVAQATYTDQTGGDISNLVSWTSSNPTLLSVDATGLATAHPSPQGGSVTITATTGSFTNSTTVTIASDVTDVLTAVTVVPTSSRIAAGTPQQLTALGAYSDGTQRDITSSVTWTSSNPSVATVSPTGQVVGVTAGTATVLGQLGTLQSPSTVIVTPATLVSVAVSPSGASFANGTTQQFKLIGTFSDGSTQDLTAGATWSSNNVNVASISTTGLATGTGTGGVQLSGTFNGQTATTSTVQVTPAVLVSIAVQPDSAAFAKGTSQQFQVTGTYSDGTTQDVTGLTTWQSSNPTVVNISSTGLATGVGQGTVTITANVGGVTATTNSIQSTVPVLTSIAITPANPRIAAGTNQQFVAIGTFSDGTTQDLTNQVVWASTNPNAATINQFGVAESGTPGSTQFTATYQGVTSTTGNVQVTQAVLTALNVTLATGTIAKGTTQQITATGTFSDGSTEDLTSQVLWSSSNAAVLAVNSTGLASGVGTGSAQVTATSGSFTASTGTIQVTPATLTSIAIAPVNPSLPKGSTQQFTITGTFSDNSTQDVTSSATWTSSNPGVATINSTGVANGIQIGSTAITGHVGSLTSSTTFAVNAATPVSISVSPNTASIAKGTRQQFTATETYSDGSTSDVTNGATWTSSSTSALTIGANGLATGAGVGSATVTATLYNLSSTTGSITVGPATLASVSVSPANLSITVSGTQQLAATGTYTDGTTQDLTQQVVWTTSASSVVAVNSVGLATGIAAGSATIQAQDGSLTATTAVTVTNSQVTPQSLTITPSNPSIAKGTQQQFVATVTYSDGSTQNVTAQTTWQSATSSVATINSSGLATGVNGGTSQITGTYGSLTSSVVLTVSGAALNSLAITPASAGIAVGTTQQYTATGTLTDGSTTDLTNSATWSSNNTGTATISATGLATAHATGSATIQAQSGSVQSNSATLTVTSAAVSSLQVQPSSVSLAAGNTQQLTVTANFTDGSSQNVTQSATYASSNTSIATVSSGGLISSVAQGSATVTVTLGSNSTTVPVTVSTAVLQSIAITPSPLSLAAGSSQQLTAIGTYSDGSTAVLTNNVTWSTSNSNIFTVSATGLLTSSTAGNATVTAALNGVSGTLPVTVTAAVIRAISVTPSNATLAAGQTQQYTAIATLSDGSQQTVTTSAHWSVSDSTRASISNASGSNGLLTSIAAGVDTVTATVGSVNGNASLTVTSATLSSLSITPAAFTLAQGTTQQLVVTGTYSDNSNQDLTNAVTYTTSAPGTASVSNTGLVTATGTTGVATIMATYGSVSATAAATALPATLLAIAVTPANPTIPNGLTEQFTATGTYAGNQQNITSQVQWTSSNPGVATINAAGLATSVGPGTTTITATSGTMSGTTTLTVGSAALQNITVTAAQTSFALGLTLQLHATGNYSDGTTADLTNSVTWTSQNTAVGVVSSTGVANGVAAGVFGAQASINGKTSSLALTVTNAVLQSITLTPANPIIVNVLGNSTQFTATGHFSDGSTQVLTSGVHWALTGTVAGIGTISQTGKLSATAVGSGNVTATYGSITGTTGFTVVSI